MINTNKLPVVIVANYRTGSTVLARSMSKILNVENLVEPHYKPARWDIFTKCLSSNDNSFVLKFIAEQTNEFAEYRDILNRDCFKVRLYRENKIDQIVSYYVATVTDTWCQTIDSVIKPYYLPLDEEKAIYAINRIMYNDKILDTLPVKFDITTTYEELGIIENTHIVQTTQPTNVASIKSFIERIYNESR